MKVKYTLPVVISIQAQFHQIVENALQEHSMERASTSLSATERATKRQPVLYANDLANMINIMSHRFKKQKAHRRDLVDLLKKYKVLPNQDMPIQSITQLASEKLKQTKELLGIKEHAFDALAMMMRDEAISPQKRKEIVQKINPREGRVLLEFIDYFHNKTIQINNRNITNFMSSLFNFDQISQVKYHFKALNQVQRKFLQPICTIYEQYINNQQQIQSQMTQKKSSLIRSLFLSNKAKAGKQELLIKRGPQRREFTSPPKQQAQDYQLAIQRLQSELEEQKRKDKQYARLHEQNQKYRSQIQRLKLSMVTQEEEDQRQRRQYELMIPFQTVSKQMQAQLAFYKNELEITKVRLQKIQEEAKKTENTLAELQYLRQSNKKSTEEIDRVTNQNQVLRVNEAKYKKNYACLQALLRQYESEQKIMQGELLQLKQRVLSSQHPNIVPQHEQSNRQNTEGGLIQYTLNVPSDQIHQLTQQNTRLKHQITLYQHKMARLSEASQLMAASRQQKITTLQLKLLSLTQQHAHPQ